jgi:choice-of-anchor B domain-containing protein
MKCLSTTLLLISLLCTCVSAQNAFNTALRDNLDYADDLNDVWGYVAPDGTEYALVGLYNRLSIVSLADPDNIVEVASVSGANSAWRDMKTYGEHAYVVAEKGQDGILSVDLSNLPTSVTHQFYNTNNLPSGDLKQAHNLFIDEGTGLAYLAGASFASGRVNNGGMVIYDVATTPGVPAFVAFGPSIYSHDVFVQNDLMYASEIYAGKLTIYDVSDLQNITTVGSTPTPTTFTHNAWASADDNYVFTTDERGGASTAAYGISDPSDIMLMDEFRPARSLNTSTIPHNVHVHNNYLVISHYTDGVEIVDAADPDNLIEVAYYDTWMGGNGGFNGSWGAYPFLPSGLMLASDIDNGLFVFEVDYQRASRLAGNITDAVTGAVLNNVTITIADPAGTTDGSTATGNYKTGVAANGMINVTYVLSGYVPQTIAVDFQRGVETIQDVALVSSALPVTLSSFTAAPFGKSSVHLAWSTAFESGSDHFLVERSSLTGTEFELVGQVDAAGDSEATKTYDFTDSGLDAGAYFYRLRQVDLDGSFAFSGVREVTLDGVGELSVFPNPVGDRLQLSADVSGTVRIYRNDGALVRESNAAGRKVNVLGLPAGQYWLRVGEERLSFVKK